MNIAIIPLTEEQTKDRCFVVTGKGNESYTTKPASEMREYFLSKGYSVHTVDMYEKLSEVDWFVFNYFNFGWYKSIRNQGLINKSIYVSFEPPIVEERHSDKNFHKLKKYFKYILTWNKTHVDNERVFKFSIPYSNSVNWGCVPFNEKSLLTCISGNKVSNDKDELYSERKKVIDYCNKNSIDGFSLYGRGWNPLHLNCYKGAPEEKAMVYHNFKFALVFENAKNYYGYVTEKIYDCMCYGIVPVYWGAVDIEKYIPKSCFIPFESFDSIKEMINTLETMDETTYNKYLNHMKNFLKENGLQQYNGYAFAQTIDSVFEHDNTDKERFECSNFAMLQLRVDRVLRAFKLIYKQTFLRQENKGSVFVTLVSMTKFCIKRIAAKY